MKHPTEDELILHRYGESSRPAGIEAHRTACEACRLESDRLARTLALLDALPVPERPEAYEEDLWRRLRPRLSDASTGRRHPVLASRPWLLGASLAALLVAAFLAGRLWPRPVGVAPLAPQVRERILLLAVGDHLDRSQMVLLEFVHAPSSKHARESERAEELASANRLYRQTAARAGETGVADVLDQLERVLLEIAHSPTAEAREALRRRIESEGMLFKVRVIRSQVRERENVRLPAPARS